MITPWTFLAIYPDFLLQESILNYKPVYCPILAKSACVMSPIMHLVKLMQPKFGYPQTSRKNLTNRGIQIQ